jgi:hypothetical protein
MQRGSGAHQGQLVSYLTAVKAEGWCTENPLGKGFKIHHENADHRAETWVLCQGGVLATELLPLGLVSDVLVDRILRSDRHIRMVFCSQKDLVQCLADHPLCLSSTQNRLRCNPLLLKRQLHLLCACDS